MIPIKKKTSNLKEKNTKGHIHIVIGSSRFGARVAIKYAKSGLYVTVIDKDKNSYYKLGENFLGSFIVGDATKISTLEDADIFHAKSVILATDNDDVNIYLANLIFTKYHKTNIIVRLDDEDKHDLLVSNDIKIINPFLNSMIQFVEMDKEG